MPLAAMLHSALAGLRPGWTITAHVIDAGLSATDRERLTDVAERHGTTIQWHQPLATGLAALPAWGRMTSTTYHRLLLPQLLPAGVSRAIWLDCDLLLTTDLVRLWETDVGDCHLLAVRDSVVPLVSSRYGIHRWRELGLRRGAQYFNAGVMLLDVDRWREDDVGALAGDYLRQAPDVMFWDQEGLNAVLTGRWGELDPRWNRMASAMRRGDNGRSARQRPGRPLRWRAQAVAPSRTIVGATLAVLPPPRPDAVGRMAPEVGAHDQRARLV